MKVEVFGYGTRPCQWCDKAKALLTERGLSFTYFAIDDNDDHADELFARKPDAATVPQIFIDDRHIGGYDNLLKELGDG